MNNNKRSVKNIIAELLPVEIWLDIFNHLAIYDVILFRSTCKALRQLAKEIRPFSPTFVSDPKHLVEYFARNGYVSCIEYAISLGVEIDFVKLAEVVTSEGKNQNHINVLKFIEKQCPSINKSSLALTCAKNQCNRAMLKYLTESTVVGTEIYSTIEATAKKGHYDCMKMLIDLGYERTNIVYTPSMKIWQYFLSKKYTWPKDTKFVEEALAEGNLQMLQLGLKHGAQFPEKVNDIKTIECVQYILENTSNTNLLHSLPYALARCLYTAIQRNDLELVKYCIYERECLQQVALPCLMQALEVSKEMYEIFAKLPMLNYDMFGYDLLVTTDPAKMKIEPTNLPTTIDGYSEGPFAKIVQKNDVNTFKFALEKWPLDQKKAEKCLLRAIFHSTDHKDKDNIEIITILFKKYRMKVKVAMEHAAKYGSVNVLQFLTEQGAKWTNYHVVCASESGLLESLAYLHKIGCSWSSQVCDKSGTYLCLKYAREHGCPWTTELLIRLIENLGEANKMKGHEKKEIVWMLRYAVWNGCPMDEQTRKDIDFLIENHPSLNIRYNNTKK